MAIPQVVLEKLACPRCQGNVVLNEPENGLICESCQVWYEIKDDIPDLRPEQARPLPAAG